MNPTSNRGGFFIFITMNKKSNYSKHNSDFVKETLEGAEGGHDWFHIERVYKNALAHLSKMTKKLTPFIVQLGALIA